MRAQAISRIEPAAAVVAAIALALHWMTPSLHAADCTQTSVGFTPLNDLGSGLYLGQFPGGLYPAGLNQPPAAHAAEGASRAAAVEPLTTLGKPSPAGRYVLLSIGMSNTTQEYQRFMQLAAASPLVNHTTLRIVDGASGGQTASTWDSPTDPNYDRVRDMELAPLGLTEAQVQVAWVKVANAGPTVSLPNSNADAYLLLQQSGNIARALKVRYPNIRIAFLSSRIYAGYASTMLNPEPYAYESAFGTKWVIQSQVSQMSGGPGLPQAGNLNYDTVAPWLAWGPYLWTDGLVPRSDGLIWQCSDLGTDGTHPSAAGREKVAQMLMQFMLNSPFAAPWFRADGGLPDADINDDGVVDGLDIGILLSQWSAGGAPLCGATFCPADLNHDGVVDGIDLGIMLSQWTG